MQHRTIIAVVAALALSVPVATTAFAAGRTGVKGGGHAMGHVRGGHMGRYGGGRHYVRGYRGRGGYGYGYGRGYGYGYGGCGYYDCDYDNGGAIVGGLIGGILSGMR